jgi:NAD(P)H-nitrite reductase large subunit
MSEEHLIVIGNGPAGNQAAHTLKDKAPEARITLISRDQKGFYKPCLLPDYLAGSISEEQIYLSTVDSYDEKGIKLRSGQEVVDVNPRERKIVLDHKEVVRFDGLIIAVGGKPRIPEPLLIFKDLMMTLKTPEDTKAWIKKLSQVDRVLIIGGDLTSLAITKALVALGKEVYFMLDENAFWPLRCDEAMFQDVSDRLSLKGVKTFYKRRLKGLAQTAGYAVEVRLDDETLEVGLIGAFFGLIPDIEFLARSGLLLDRGILVNETLNTGFEGIYATGDCAQVYHPEIRDYWISIGHDNAKALGRTAALNLLGERLRVDVETESLFDVQGIKVNTSWWMEF